MTGSRRNRSASRALLTAIIGCASLLVALPCDATEAPGSLGFKLGDNNGRLHPYVDIDTHWVTNPGRLFFTGQSDVMSSGRLGFDLLFPSSILELRGDGGISYNKYWGVVVPQTANLSAAAGWLTLDAHVNKDGFLTVRLNNTFLRSADPANQTVTLRLLHNVEQASVAFDIKPGGGALILTLGGGYFLDRYDAQTGLDPNSLNNYRILPEARITWKFLPKTGIFIEGQGQLNYFEQGFYVNPVDQVQVSNVDTRILSVAAGVTGSISHRISTTLKGGYANTFISRGGDNLQTYVGLLDFIFELSDTGKLNLGVNRGVQPTSFFRYFTMNRIYVRYEQQIASNTAIMLSPQLVIYDYGLGLLGPQITRRDYNYLAEVSIAQRLGEWMTLSIIDRFDLRYSNYQASGPPPEYRFNDVLLRVDVRY